MCFETLICCISTECIQYIHGEVADVLLWRRKREAVILLVSSSSLWFLFERAGYNLLTFVANVLLLLVVILFFWAKSASLLNRPLPPIPDLEVSEEFVVEAAEVARVWVNHALSAAREIAIARNLGVFFKLVLSFWLIFLVGSFFTFLVCSTLWFYLVCRCPCCMSSIRIKLMRS